jgi:KDO2-lipid IV(A) lauroyltransferase
MFLTKNQNAYLLPIFVNFADTKIFFMKKTGYYLFYSFAWFVSILPTKLQYIISDFFYLIVFYVVKYRREVVYKNLKNSFPDKSEKQLKKIEKAFYHHLVDLFIEEMAMLNLSEKEINKRHKFINLELIDKLYAQNIGIVGVTGHYCNWEWIIYLQRKCNYRGLAIYKPLSDKNFEKFMNKNRERYGALAVPMKKTLKQLIIQVRKNELPFSVMVADQSPGNDESNYWTTFLNQETAFYMGVEKIAKKFNHAVVFISMRKVKRGYYETTFELITENKRVSDY